MLSPQFKEKTATQAAAFFLRKAGGELHIVKLLKLLYFADRLAYGRRASSITGDHAFSMDHGPVLSETYDLLKGAIVREGRSYWKRHISEKDGNSIKLLKDPAQGALSPAELGFLESTWSDLGALDPWELSRRSHELPEWQDPSGSSRIIPVENILSAVGLSDHQILEIQRAEREFDAEDRILARLAADPL